MGITLHTALVIQGNEVKVYAFSDKESRKFGFEIGYMERDNYRPLLSTHAVYGSKEEAEKAGNDFVREVKEMDLGEHVRKIQGILPKEERDLVGKIVEDAR